MVQHCLFERKGITKKKGFTNSLQNEGVWGSRTNTQKVASGMGGLVEKGKRRTLPPEDMGRGYTENHRTTLSVREGGW